MKARPLLAATPLIAALVLTSSASAAVTIGSNLADAPDTSGTCALTSPLRQCTLASVGPTSPSNGVVVRWRLRADPATSAIYTVKLRVLSGNTGLATGPNEAPDNITATFTFPSRLPIAVGNRIGVDVTVAGAVVSGAGFKALHISGAADSFDIWDPPLTDGATTAPGVVTNRELLLNADVEPDADHDGYGDESQDQCPTDPSTQGPCPAKPDTAAPKLTPTGKTSQKLGKSVVIGAGCDEPCTLAATGSISTSGAKVSKSLALNGAKATLPVATTVLRLSIPAKSRKRAARVLKRHGKASAAVTIVAKDAAGNVATASRKIRLRR